MLSDTLVSLSRLSADALKSKQARIVSLEEEGIAKDLVIANQTERHRLDHTTEIPNEIALHHEKHAKLGVGKVLIIIDIVKFGEFNNKHGRDAANKLLKAMGKHLYLGSRRLENVYRLNKTKMELEVPKGGGAYRLHQAGDEFAVILQGGEADALGFLTRVRSFCKKYSETELPHHESEILFYAGVAAVVETGNADEIFELPPEIRTVT